MKDNVRKMTNPNETPLDGTKGGKLDPPAPSDGASNESELTRLEQLKKQDMAKLIKTCAKAIKNIKDKELDRAENNADMAAERAKLEALGISKEALEIVIKISKMDAAKMDGFDLAYHTLRESIDMPVEEFNQKDMFGK